jgi:hypothetical protein
LVRLFTLLVILAVLTVILFALPASMIKRFLPPSVRAEDFSGSLWHGSAALTVNSHGAGALEWRIHPWSLLTLTVATDLHWVDVGFVADASADIDRHGLSLRNAQGGGPVEDLAGLGVLQGWRGTAAFKFTRLKVVFGGGAAANEASLVSAVGEVNVSDLASSQVADGADLGGYALHIANGAITPDADAAAELSDTGGPLEVQATIHFSTSGRSGTLSGTVKERADAPPALRSQLSNLAQLHARDAEGRIPVDLEFTL